ncbi:MAG: ribonuclease P protein component, partial [Planctomycetes bacterium]|nr:ribonuclease P protein component [Planctomycetota bacterium]
VVRNRAKRLIREVFRRIKNQITPAVDIVIISGKDLVLLPFSTLEQKILQAFKPNLNARQ